ncbi:adenosine receptor A3-like [Anneissia japonica]|uniref:adenosine receptor A3-like n=1 Tax=Anneissia japonica TaxID=1529436 RepID=UPI0014258B15|nr:adenosine receptor A3-like [Anneissia japonica]XP_033121031.1 adenosine receptor A3-like [Anneissia japonica]
MNIEDGNTTGSEFDPHSNCTLPDIRTTPLYQNKNVFLFYLVSFVIICVLILLGNSIVLWAFATDQKIRSRKYVLIFSLCLTDLATGFVIPIQILAPPSVIDAFGFSLLLISVSTNLAIAVDRFYILVVANLNISRKGATAKQLIIFCVLLWVGILAFILPWTIYPYYYILILYTLGPWSVVAIMIGVTGLYISIFYTMRKMDKQKQKKLGKGDFKRTKMVVRAYAVIVVCFGVCWLPWCIEAIRISFESYFTPDNQSCYVASIVACFLLNFGLLNSAINPLIYWRKLHDFRHAINNLPIFRRCMTRCCVDNPESTTGRTRMHNNYQDGTAVYDGREVQLE